MKRTTALALAVVTCLAAQPLPAQEAQVIEPELPGADPSPPRGEMPPASGTEPALAQARTYVDVLASLESSGYAVDAVRRTLLGRVKITARNTTHVREVVVSRSTGEIMSDQVVQVLGNLASGEQAASALGGASAAVAGTAGPSGEAGGSAGALDTGFSGTAGLTGRAGFSVGLGSGRGASADAAGRGSADLGASGAADQGAGGVDVGADLGIGGGIGLGN